MEGIAYHNKDIASKMTAEAIKGNSLAAFGLPDKKVVAILPTNLPAIESNELRLDNLFLLEDGSVAIIDYESQFKKENFSKYMNYVARVIRRYADQKQMDTLQQLKVLVIYTADVEWAQEVYDLGDVTLRVEASYLVRQNTDEIYKRLSKKIYEEEELTAEDLAQLMILPLTVKGTDAKQVYIEKAVGLAKQLSNHEQMMRVISGILTFTDKVIDQKYAEKVRNELMMTKVERLIFEDGFEDGAVKGRTEGRTVGRSEGEFLKLIGQVQKKCSKGKSLVEIAAELEEEEADIAPIIACIREHAQFTKEEILSELHVMA